MMLIMGPASATQEKIWSNCTKIATPHPDFLKVVEAIYGAALRTGVDPVVMVAQSAKETNWWKFGGRIDASWANTAGMKIRDPINNDDRPENHARFPLGLDGRPHASAMAQAHQLMSYAGRDVPIDTPGHRVVHVMRGTPKFGSAPYVELLGGKWAPDVNYGTSVVTLAQRLVTGK